MVLHLTKSISYAGIANNVLCNASFVYLPTKQGRRTPAHAGMQQPCSKTFSVFRLFPDLVRDLLHKRKFRPLLRLGQLVADLAGGKSALRA